VLFRSGGDTGIRGRDLSALKNELDNLRAADVLDRAGPVRDAAPVIFNPAADASGMAAIPDPIAAATSPSPVPALIISRSMIETALQNHMLQPLDFSFNNYNKGLPGGVCNGASVVWLNKMAEAGVQRAINIDSDRTVGAEILELQKKFENADLSIADMKGDQALHATRFDPFGEEPLNVAAQFESDGKVDKQTRLLTVEAVATGIAQKLRSSDDFAFVQLSRGDGNGHACAIFRDAGDKVHFFDPDIGAYSFNADAEGLARLGAKLVDSMTPARNQLTLIFGSM